MEVSRWIVAPAARGTAVGSRLVLSAWAVGAWLSKGRLLAAVGARDGQTTMLGRLGGQIPRSIPAKFIEEYDDDLVAMSFDWHHPLPRVAAQLGAVANVLKLTDRPMAIRPIQELEEDCEASSLLPHS
jgi:hypothetical protein